MLARLELCLVVVPSGACLVASSPGAPGLAEGLAHGRGEQLASFGHRHADQADVVGWFLAGAGREPANSGKAVVATARGAASA
jgi:hypothetical protein